ncbi:MAG: TIGR03790 family protein [Planctomycetota bacterium]
MAKLLPEEVAVIAARGNRESLALAKYYCQQRSVPLEHICEVDLVPGEFLDREKWRWAVRPEIQKWIKEKDPEAKLRCLVTTWGVPLKIGKSKADAKSKAYRDYVTGERTLRVKQLNQIADLLDQLGRSATNPGGSRPKPSGDEDFAALRQRLETSLQDAQSRIANLSPGRIGPASQRLQQLATAAGGGQVLLQGLNRRMTAGGEVPTAAKEQFDVLRGRSSAFTEMKLSLERRPPNSGRDSLILRTLQQTGGLIAAIEWLDTQVSTVKKHETAASFDSELSLVMWEDGYELLRWQPNYLRPEFTGSQLRESYRTLIVARIDGPKLSIAKRLIDDAIAVEKQGGLKGKVYLDARGLAELNGPPLSPGSYPDYDRSLLQTSEGLSALTNDEGEPRFDVTLDTEPKLFRPGQCPDAGMYCGWYSLAKYVDAFDWNRGAIAYHMASSEAVTLKELDSQAWCKSLLADGVCVTIGPAFEPYLVAFPRPNEFFAQLLGGATVGEVYAQTKPYNSWAMVLVGDPLYTPFPPAVE